MGRGIPSPRGERKVPRPQEAGSSPDPLPGRPQFRAGPEKDRWLPGPACPRGTSSSWPYSQGTAPTQFLGLFSASPALKLPESPLAGLEDASVSPASGLPDRGGDVQGGCGRVPGHQRHSAPAPVLSARLLPATRERARGPRYLPCTDHPLHRIPLLPSCKITGTGP